MSRGGDPGSILHVGDALSGRGVKRKLDTTIARYPSGPGQAVVLVSRAVGD